MSNATLAAPSSFFRAKQRRLLGGKLADSKILGGNKRVDSKGQGISEVTRVLDEAGYSLDMVAGDLLLGDHGTRLLSFRKANAEGADPFSEEPQYENCRVSFTWENINSNCPHGSLPRYEILAYLS